MNLLLENGANLECKDEYGLTPLSLAAQQGHEAVVKLLLEQNAELECKDHKYGLTPLSLAAERGHEAVVKLLLEKGANTESIDSSCRTPLSCATEKGHDAAVELLLAKDSVDPNSEDNIKWTPLLFAARNGHDSVVMMLLAHHIDPDPKDHYGSTPLSITARSCRTEVVKSLLATVRVEVDCRDCFQRTPLWRARKGGSADVDQLLLGYAEKRGIPVCENDGCVEVSLKSHDGTSRGCDVCTLSIPQDDVYFSCGVCNGGNFDICLECYKIGGRCSKDGHELIQRKDKGESN